MTSSLPTKCPSCGLGARFHGRAAWPLAERARLGVVAGVGFPSGALGLLPGTILWTTWRHRTAVTGGKPQRTSFGYFTSWIQGRASAIVPKESSGPFAGSESSDGHIRDASLVSINIVTFDCDGAGPWDALIAVLEAAGVAYVASMSSSWKPGGLAKWHVSVPLAESYKPRSKDDWLAEYSHVAGFLSGLARFPGVGSRGERHCGFDLSQDRLLQPIFPGARRDATSPPREVRRRVDGRALVWERFLELTGYEPALVAELRAPRAKAERRALDSVDAWAARAASEQPARSTDVPARALPPLARAFEIAGWLGNPTSRGWKAKCPNSAVHTSGDGWEAEIGATGRFTCWRHGCRGMKADVAAFRHNDAVKALPPEARALYDSLRDTGGVARTRAALARVPVPTRVPVSEVPTVIRSALESALERDEVLAIRITPGGTKTSTTIAYARVRSDVRLALVAASNNLAKQVTGDLRRLDIVSAPRPTVRLSGVSSVVNENGQHCASASKRSKPSKTRGARRAGWCAHFAPTGRGETTTATRTAGPTATWRRPAPPSRTRTWWAS